MQAADPFAAWSELDRETRRVFLFAGLASFFASYGGSVLFYALPAVSNDFHARLHALANLGSILALGAVFALPLAALADRTGRRRVIAAGVLAFSLADVASALTTDIGQLTVTRFIAVCFEETVLAVAAVLVVEEVPREHRAISNAVLAVAAGAGITLTTFLYPIAAPHWRLVYLPAVIGIPGAYLVWKRLPEGRTWRALSREHSPLHALATPPWRSRLAILAVSALLGALLYEPIGLFGAYFGSRILNLSPAAISGIVVLAGPLGGVGFLTGGWLSDRFGRRWLGVALSLAAAATDAVTFVGGLPAYALGTVVSSIAAGALSPLLTAWVGELLPTRGRATGETVTVIAAALGGALGLQLFGIFEPNLGFRGVTLLTMFAALAGALLLLALPETRAKVLEE